MHYKCLFCPNFKTVHICHQNSKVELLVIFSYQCEEYFTHSYFALKRVSSVYTSIVL